MELLDVGLELVGGAQEAAASLVAQESVLNRYMYGVDLTTIKYESYPIPLGIATMLPPLGGRRVGNHDMRRVSFFFLGQCPETGAG